MTAYNSSFQQMLSFCCFAAIAAHNLEVMPSSDVYVQITVTPHDRRSGRPSDGPQTAIVEVPGARIERYRLQSPYAGSLKIFLGQCLFRIQTPGIRKSSYPPRRYLLWFSWTSPGLACIAYKSLEICDRCRLRQQNSPATPENSTAF